MAVELVNGTVCREFRTAWFCHWLKFHQFHASPVRVIKVSLPFAVLTHLRTVVSWAEAILSNQGGHRLLHIGHPKRKVIQNTKFVLVDAIEWSS